MHLLYAACLLVSVVGMAILDWRYRLFWFHNWRMAAAVHGIGLGVFLLWDVSGIAFGIFARGNSPYMTGIEIVPELPVEEVAFLIFLCWLTMNTYSGINRLGESYKSDHRKFTHPDRASQTQTRP